MPSNLRYSAANSSTIAKRPSLSPVKKIQRDFKKSLSSNSKSPQSPNNSSAKSQEKRKDDSEKLEILDYDVKLDFQLPRKYDVLEAVNTIVQNQWSESTAFNNRYHSNHEIARANSMEDLVFSLKNISLSAKADIIKYRNSLPEGLVTINQLYSIYNQEGNTFVDKNLEIQIRKGALKKFVISNAAPVISRRLIGPASGRIMYGHENVEVITKQEGYLKTIEKTRVEIDKQINEDTSDTDRKKLAQQIQTLNKFENFIKDNPTALFVTMNDDFELGELSALVSLGYVTLTSNHLNEIESHQWALSYPNCGTFLKLINAGRAWLVKSLMKDRYSEGLENKLFAKWEGNSNMNSTTKMANFRNPFYGYDLNWILGDALGAGIIEVFNTPVGRGWRLTGKV